MKPALTTKPESTPHFPTHHALHHDPRSAQLALLEEERRNRAEKAKRNERQTYFFALGRFLLAGVFVTGGLVKIAAFDATREAMVDAGLAGASFYLWVAIALELVGGVMLAGGFRVRPAAAAMLGYLIAVTILVHGDLTIELNRAFALANLAIAGGLLMLVAHGAGALSLDKLLGRREAARSAG